MTKATSTCSTACGDSLKATMQECSDSHTNQIQNLRLVPLIFSTDMVTAIRTGRKSVTRRLVKSHALKLLQADMTPEYVCDPGNSSIHDYGSPSDIIWVRETWQHVDIPGDFTGYVFKIPGGKDWEMSNDEWTWKPSIHMPKVACRLFLQITSLRIERLQDITEDQAKDEGVIDCTFEGVNWTRYKDYNSDPSGHGDPCVDFPTVSTAKESFETLWTKLNNTRAPWDSNPWVWVIEFQQCDIKFTSEIKKHILDGKK